MEAMRARLDGWLGQPHWKQGKGRATFVYRFESETKPVTPLRLKVEINTREHFCVLGPRQAPFQVDSPWYSSAVEVSTYELEELLGTKLRALYQRKKGRDLFDLSQALTQPASIDPAKIIACFLSYLEHEGRRITRQDFEDNLSEKIEDKAFLSDLAPLLARGVSFDPVAALHHVKDALISRMPEPGPGRDARTPSSTRGTRRR